MKRPKRQKRQIRAKKANKALKMKLNPKISINKLTHHNLDLLILNNLSISPNNNLNHLKAWEHLE